MLLSVLNQITPEGTFFLAMLKQYNGLLAAFPQIGQKRFISAASVAVKMQKMLSC